MTSLQRSRTQWLHFWHWGDPRGHRAFFLWPFSPESQAQIQWISGRVGPSQSTGLILEPFSWDRGRQEGLGCSRFTKGFSEWPVAVGRQEGRSPPLRPLRESRWKSRDSAQGEGRP